MASADFCPPIRRTTAVAMQFLMLFNPDFSPFDRQVVERAFRSCDQFTDFRLDDPLDSPIECQYREPDDWTTIRLSKDASSISINNAWRRRASSSVIGSRRTRNTAADV